MKVIKKYYLLLGKLVLSLKGEYYGAFPLQIEQVQMRIAMAKIFLEQGPTHRSCPETRRYGLNPVSTLDGFMRFFFFFLVFSLLVLHSLMYDNHAHFIAVLKD